MRSGLILSHRNIHAFLSLKIYLINEIWIDIYGTFMCYQQIAEFFFVTKQENR